MKNFLTAILKSKAVRRLMIPAAVFCALASTSLLSGAARPATALTINNNSNWELRHVYLAPPNTDDWGPDLLNGAVIAPGQSLTLNIECGGGEVKVITEDRDGCFLSNTVSCSASAEWTITNNATPNCGGS
jgi:hypothetical protein